MQPVQMSLPVGISGKVSWFMFVLQPVCTSRLIFGYIAGMAVGLHRGRICGLAACLQHCPVV